ncbi:DinB family protein [Mycobacterium talmoniae]|uniref:DinB-like domain-containing protein n=1 Tax=Mycobacterium talmoniae TaxID=1858794 RepID=A0A1S1NG74_9MYCO|nr:DinB family protein [Mycobacterium talmoniae]OHV00248.1 hypothetical protein BKN37_18315 [Mycobacterium talmoniae]
MTRPKLPPLAAEDHVCEDCNLAYSDISVDDAVAVITELPAAVRGAVAGVPAAARGTRLSPQAWSVTEYVCHLRDVYMVSTIRLHRIRTEDTPALEPLFNDLRARRFRYNERELTAVLDELESAVAGFCEEVTATAGQDWERIGTRLPGETRTARWLVRQAMHEGVHHLSDINRIGAAIGSG